MKQVIGLDQFTHCLPRDEFLSSHATVGNPSWMFANPFHSFTCLATLRQSFSTSALLLSECFYFFILEGCLLNCRMFSIPGLYCVNTRSTPCIVAIKNVVRYFLTSPREIPPLSENYWSKPMNLIIEGTMDSSPSLIESDFAHDLSNIKYKIYYILVM